MKKEFFEISYQKHREERNNNFDEEKVLSWAKKDTTDYWRHQRMYDNLIPLINKISEDKWLTIGDGRYGTDANYLLTKGVKSVLSTDISDACLKMAKKNGFISDYKNENAESLSFKNNSFDYVLCKESYHHFPRPMLALYEMLRVARKSVILIEPQDNNILIPSRFRLNTLIKWSKQVIKNSIKKALKKEIYYYYGNYEKVGNYVYTISEREIEKVALGLNYEMVSFKNFNDFYMKGVEFETMQKDAKLYKTIKKSIQVADIKMKKGLLLGNTLIAMIHKKEPCSTTLKDLNQLGFVNRKLPQNPYL